MFPKGTQELALPIGMLRTENHRGVFHYNPEQITEERIHGLSSAGNENEFLELGPYSKNDVLDRVISGEKFMTVMEVTSDGVEVRAALGSTTTIPDQLEYFEHTKDVGNIVTCVKVPPRVQFKRVE